MNAPSTPIKGAIMKYTPWNISASALAIMYSILLFEQVNSPEKPAAATVAPISALHV